jgi:hypothetical protein
VALILALNPGNRHSPTLARLARELSACELIGAESSNVAISAIKKRVPDVVLLPAIQARGQADLLAHLKTIPGGVMTLRLPPVESADPADLARQIREMLTGVPAQVPVRQATGRQVALPDEPPPGPSPHLLAAATAAIGWARTRRDQWLTEPSPEQAAPMAVPLSTAALDPVEEYQPYEPIEPSESDYPFPIDTPEEPEPGADYASQMKVWLPRVGGAAVVIAVVAAIIMYKPQGGAGSTAAEPAAASGSAATASAPPDTASVPPATDVNSTPIDPSAAKPALAADALAPVSGWVVVSSPLEVTITERGRGVQMDEGGRAMLPPGNHRLRFQNRDAGYDETLTVEVKPADTTTVNLTPQTTLSVTSSDPAEVLIDGTRAGDTPYEGKISLGAHTVTVKTAETERQQTIEATGKPVQLEIDFSKP